MAAGYDEDVFGPARPAPAGGFDPEVFGATKRESIGAPAPAPRPRPGSGSTWADAGNALGTGAWRALVRLAGMPVDTAQNVLDLGRAVAGSAYIAGTGKAPPQWLELPDRTNAVGTSEHLLDLARRTKLGRAMVDPINPDFEGGYLQAAGGGLAASVAPGTLAQATNRALIGIASNVAGKATFDATGSPELAIAASLAPSGMQGLAEAGVKRAIRGGEQGRREMERRVYELERAGIAQPTLGLASGNTTIGGAENLLQNTPGAIGVMGRARQAAIDGLRMTAENAAENASTVRGALPAGQQIQAGIGEFKDAFKARQAQLYDRVEQTVGSQFPTKVDTTRATLERLNADIPGAPQLSRFFKNSRIQALEEAVRQDVAGDPPRPAVVSTVVGADGRPLVLSPAEPGNQGTGRLPFEAIKKTRTLVGNELADSSLLSDVPRSKWSPLYAALSDDMRAAAQNAGPAAERAYSRANDHTRAGMERLGTLRPFADKAAPEQAFTSLVANARENVSVLQAVKKSLPEGARGTVAGTVIERLGRATPGQQNELGDSWSADRFLTNWNTLKPEARRELFSGFNNADQVRQDVEAVARAAALMRTNSRIWANPSGTAANAAARTLMLGAPAAALVNPWAPLAVAAGMGTANVAARTLTGPAARRFALEGDVRLPLLAPAVTMGLQGGGLLSGMPLHDADARQQQGAGLLDSLRW